MRRRFALLLAAAFIAAPAYAADLEAPAEPAPTVADGTDLVIELGLGARLVPEYEGSDEVIVAPWPLIALEYLSVPGLGSFGGPDGLGLSFGPSFGFVGSRDSDDLVGLDEIDPTVQLGAKVTYRLANAETFAALRYAFGGAEGFVGDAGAFLVARPTERLEVKAGPTLAFASSDYMDTYFGVSTAEALASGGRFAAYDADGGVKSVGLAAEVRHEFRPDWFLNAEASWDRLVGEAADSPIVERGSEDQFSVGVGVSRRFSFDLFRGG